MQTDSDPFRHAASLLALEVFRLNGALVAAGDALVAPLGLTSARWQVLGAVAQSGPLTVAQIARAMGLTRQSVQRLVNELAASGLLRLAPNPQHKRAVLVALTEAGEAAFAEAWRRWRPVADALLAGLEAEVAAATELLRAARARLEGASDPETSP